MKIKMQGKEVVRRTGEEGRRRGEKNV